MDRDLLFGVIAVQLGQATATQVMAATSAYVTDPSKGIAERLRAEGVITAERFEMLSTMVDEAIKAHGGDVKQTMQSLGGEQALYRSFGGSLVVDREGQISIDPGVERGPDTQRGPGEDSTAVTEEAPGRYRLEGEAEIGRGGIGRVLVAFDEHVGRARSGDRAAAGRGHGQDRGRRGGGHARVHVAGAGRDPDPVSLVHVP